VYSSDLISWELEIKSFFNACRGDSPESMLNVLPRVVEAWPIMRCISLEKASSFSFTLVRISLGTDASAPIKSEPRESRVFTTVSFATLA
jgi:hypothetical protein